jgi:integrase
VNLGEFEVEETRVEEAWKGSKFKKLSPRIKEKYELAMRRFLAFAKCENVAQLYKMRVEELASPDELDNEAMERRVSSWAEDLVKIGVVDQRTGKVHTLKPQTAVHDVQAVVNFFRAVHKDLKLSPIDTVEIGESTGGRKLIQKEQILEFYDNCGSEMKLRSRALIQFLKDSGVRVGDALALDVGDYQNAQVVKNEDGEVFRVFDASIAQKNKVIAIIHIGNEAIQALDEYLASRKDLTPNSPLFEEREGGRLKSKATTEIFRRIATHSSGKNLGCHSFRKFHFTSLEGAGLNENWILRLQGKKLDRARGTYSHPEELPSESGKYSNALTEAYIENYDRLRVFTEKSVEKQVKELRQMFGDDPMKTVVELSKKQTVGEDMVTISREEYARLKEQPDIQKLVQDEIAKALKNLKQ